MAAATNGWTEMVLNRYPDYLRYQKPRRLQAMFRTKITPLRRIALHIARICEVPCRMHICVAHGHG